MSSKINHNRANSLMMYVCQLKNDDRESAWHGDNDDRVETGHGVFSDGGMVDVDELIKENTSSHILPSSSHTRAKLALFLGQWDNGTIGLWDNGTLGLWDNGTTGL